jgi:hypothetical protein
MPFFPLDVSSLDCGNGLRTSSPKAPKEVNKAERAADGNAKAANEATHT